ncbi:hypothetical protein AHAS_Ahas11G0331400 [Arachis hypogaea]
MGQEFSHEGVNSEHTSYDQYEQEEGKHEEVDVDYMDEDDTNVEPMFDYHGFDEGYMMRVLPTVAMRCCNKNRSTGELTLLNIYLFSIADS